MPFGGYSLKLAPSALTSSTNICLSPVPGASWYDAFSEVYYTFGVYIAGPRGVADGIVVP